MIKLVKIKFSILILLMTLNLTAKDYSFKAENIILLYSAFAQQIEYFDLANKYKSKLPMPIESEDSIGLDNEEYLKDLIAEVETPTYIKLPAMTQILDFQKESRKVVLRIEDEFIDIDNQYSLFIVNAEPFKSITIKTNSNQELAHQNVRTDLRLKVLASTIEKNRKILIAKIISIRAYYPKVKGEELSLMYERSANYDSLNQRDNKQFELITKVDKEQIFTLLSASFNKLIDQDYLAYYESLDPLINTYVSSKEKAVELIEKSLENITVTGFNIDIPIRAFIDDDHIISIIPYTLNMDINEAETTSKVISSDYIMARKLRNSQDWKISSMNGYLRNSTQFWRMFPNFPSDLDLQETYIVADEDAIVE